MNIYHIWVFIDWGEQLYDFILFVLPSHLLLKALQSTVVYIDREPTVSVVTPPNEKLCKHKNKKESQEEGRQSVVLD